MKLEAKKIVFSDLRSKDFSSRLAAKVCISYSVVLEDARSTLDQPDEEKKILTLENLVHYLFGIF